MGEDAQDETSAAASWVKLVLGVLFILLATGQWRRRPKAGENPELPGWMKAIDTFTPVRAAGLDFLLAAINPKNLAMAIAAGVTIGVGGLSGGQETVAVIVYVVIAASRSRFPSSASWCSVGASAA